MENKSLGEMIRFLRTEKEMTQNDLAEKMKVTDKAVSKWERNVSYPHIKLIPRLAEVLDISIEELLNAEVKKEKNQMDEIMNIALIGVSFVMGVCILVTSVLEVMDKREGMILLGIGMSCLAVYFLKNRRE